MSYTPPVETFQEDGLNIDMYSDGDVLIEVAVPGYIQISAQTIRAMASKLPSLRGDKNPIIVPPSWAPRPVATTAPGSNTVDAKEVPRSVRKTNRGWESNLLNADGDVTVYVYTSRDFARVSDIAHAIGEHGRIA